MTAKDDQPLFTFAVIADTHMNQAEDYSSSPYPCNALANARTRRVIAELNRFDPAFVVHLGDIVNPVPELPTYEQAADHFKTLVADLKPPLHLVSGNHDVGDKPVSWMPAGTVNDEHLALYERHFGDHFYAVSTNGVRVVVVNAQIINSGLDAEARQRDWLEAELAGHAGERVFVCIHYPPFVSNPGEPGSYDNIDEPGRSWLLSLIRRHKPEALFCGHVHNFWYDVIGETEMYILPSTAFVRHDYSEMYRIGAGDQHGRNDEAKLGYFLVRVYPDRHVVETVRTYGRTLDPGDALPPAPDTVRVPVTKESRIADIGIDMRHAWAEEMTVAPSGGVDEFERKLARNDYPVMALWEMGMRRLRVPVQDIVDERVRRRVAIMRDANHVFHVHSYGVPTPEVCALLSRHAALVDRLEIVINWEHAESVLPDIARLAEDTGLPVFLSRVNRKDTNKYTGGRYNHLISHGFTAAEADELAALFAAAPGARAIAGVMFAVFRDKDPAAAVAEASEVARRIGRTACLYVKSTSGSPAEAFENDALNAARVAEAVAATLGTAGVETILDTFDDIDRGYFARSGLVDRRFNPKIGSRIVGNLFGLYDAEPWTVAADASARGNGRLLRLNAASGAAMALALPGTAPMAAAEATGGGACVKTVDLDTGIVTSGAPDTVSVPSMFVLG